MNNVVNSPKPEPEGASARTMRERLGALLGRRHEALSPWVLRRTLSELQAVNDPAERSTGSGQRCPPHLVAVGEPQLSDCPGAPQSGSQEPEWSGGSVQDSGDASFTHDRRGGASHGPGREERSWQTDDLVREPGVCSLGGPGISLAAGQDDHIPAQRLTGSSDEPFNPADPRRKVVRDDERREAGHWVTEQAQATRRPPMKGIEVTLAMRTPTRTLAASTIWPLPMYMPTWLIPE